MNDPFTIPIDDPRPSQLYVDAEKLRELLSWFDPGEPEYDPIPVLDGSHFESVPDDVPVLSDGHTRAVAAVLAGEETLRVRHDPDRPDLDVYETCLGWCADAEITESADLVGRLVSHETFDEQWVQRCQALVEE